MHRGRKWRHALALAGLGLLVAGMPAAGQIPDEFTNLKLLDPEITKPDLISTMKDWAGGLGVRCNHCHVGPDDLQGMDFASDEKATKRTARRMLTMSRAINGELLAALPIVEAEGRPRAQVVSCYTCHRGQPRPPRNLVNMLVDTAGSAGPEAALAEYDTLRTEHEGAGVYDFRSRTLDRVAMEYSRSAPETARRLLTGNAERHPEAADTCLLLGLVASSQGDAEAARTAFERVLELAPGHPGALEGLNRLEPEAADAEPPPDGS